jgi:hypothetical protein
MNVKIQYSHAYEVFVSKFSAKDRIRAPVTPDKGFWSRGNATCKSHPATNRFALSIFLALQSPWQTPINYFPQVGRPSGRSKYLFFMLLFSVLCFREPDNQRYLFVGASQPS